MPGKPTGVSPDRTFIAHLPEPAIITAGGWIDGGAEILFVNAAFCALTGYRAAELEGKNIRRLHGPRTDLAGLRLARQPGGTTDEGSGEGWLYRKSGAEFFARWNFRPMGSPGGPLIAVFHDHTEFWRQREAVLRSQKLDTVGMLASGVAHDFNNFLSVINGSCEILAPKVAGQPEVAKELKEIHRAGLKASAVARQILEFSRRQATEPAVVNFNTLIREIAEIIRRVCGDTIELELRLASDLGNARISPTHFQQVLLNLCFNARDAMPDGGRLVIRTFNHAVESPPPRGNRPVLSAGDWVALEVVDQGTGIPPAVLKRLFEPFYTTKPRGTGLGLATAHGIIRQARGHMAVRSTSRKGTIFEVYLPETAEPEQPTLTTLSELPATAGTESILLIERDAILRRMITGILAADGYTVTEVAIPREAVRARVRPQLAIVDMKSAATRILLGKLHRTNPALRVIHIGERASNLPGFSPKAVAHLPKPFALSGLLQQVRRLLDTVVN